MHMHPFTRKAGSVSVATKNTLKLWYHVTKTGGAPQRRYWVFILLLPGDLLICEWLFNKEHAHITQLCPFNFLLFWVLPHPKASAIFHHRFHILDGPAKTYITDIGGNRTYLPVRSTLLGRVSISNMSIRLWLDGRCTDDDAFPQMISLESGWDSF